jgi:hypothetical protein
MSRGAGKRAPENSQAKPEVTARLAVRATASRLCEVGCAGADEEKRRRTDPAASRKRKTRR